MGVTDDSSLMTATRGWRWHLHDYRPALTTPWTNLEAARGLVRVSWPGTWAPSVLVSLPSWDAGLWMVGAGFIRSSVNDRLVVFASWLL